MFIVSEDSQEYNRLDPELKVAWQTAQKFEPEFRRRLENKFSRGPLPDLPDVMGQILKTYEDRIVASRLAEPEATSAKKPANLYELVGAYRLATSNQISRQVATKLGSAWEKLALLSHKAISPELEGGARIAGVDIIILDGSRLRHTQIKTQRNTLTGSQGNRSVAELRMYPHPLFAAAFDVASWTFNSPEIERVAGPAFWAMLGIPYDQVVAAARECLLNIERRVLDV